MNVYARVKGGEVLEFPYALEKIRSDFPNKSFGEEVSEREAISCGVVVVHTLKKPYDRLVETLEFGEPIQELRQLQVEDLVDPHTKEFYEGYSEKNIGDTVTTGRWVCPEKSVKLPVSLAESNIRSRRDALLQETDWIVIKSYERGENIPAEWELYRQALRDITEQAGFPYEVTWPTKP